MEPGEQVTINQLDELPTDLPSNASIADFDELTRAEKHRFTALVGDTPQPSHATAQLHDYDIIRFTDYYRVSTN